jgi:hypothetical protein
MNTTGLMIPTQGRPFPTPIQNTTDVHNILGGNSTRIECGAFDIHTSDSGIQKIEFNPTITVLIHTMQFAQITKKYEGQEFTTPALVEELLHAYATPYVGDAIITGKTDTNGTIAPLARQALKGYITGWFGDDLCNLCTNAEPAYDAAITIDNRRAWGHFCQACFIDILFKEVSNQFNSLNQKDTASSLRSMLSRPRFGLGHGQILLDPHDYESLT